MNYLAHLHLGGPQPAQLLGSLYGDFVKGRLQGQWPDEIERAIQLHRRIDAFTDSHPLVHAAKRRFPLERRRFAGVLLDVFFDHCLARIAPRMAAQDWLGSYREFAVLREVLGGMSRRLSRPHLLDGSWEELAQRYDDLSADFRAFYPQLQAFALSQR
ncbi:DUF479 domain-containing protein [Pseudomonas aeruginosa]|uniref:acyl carrier protein phosphodiesterase n=1 Tax=Pseudomonas aeruginosa TaxID=287 RepID=UPI00106841B6|nr:ACP phosphodiesterase [Pseudomonas aeruginosa]TEL14247.1 DUF479 domain-containing protein [Pseudomonas aeruginosa]